MTIGDRLREARKKAGLSAAALGQQVAQAMGRDKPISASAVRNQENGTNGVPYEAIAAYSQVLEVEKAWLAFGEGEDLPRSRPTQLISLMPPIGAGWSPADLIMEANRPAVIRVHVPEFDSVKLFASEVAAGAPLSDFPPGTLIIYAWIDSVGARGGDHVVVYRTGNADQIQHSLRVVRAKPEGVFLDPLPEAAKSEKPIAVGDRSAYVAGVVVATYRLVPPKVGPLLVTTSKLTTEKLLTSE